MGVARSRRLGFGAAAIVIGATAIAVPATLGHASSVTPGLRLVTGLSHLEADRYGDSWDLYIPEAVYVEATHGAFEIDVARHDGHLTFEQVVRDGSSVKKIRSIKAPEHVKLRDGLPKFLSVTMTDSTGKIVTSAHPSFCPTASYDTQRIDPNGPDNPTYPQTCGSRLTEATVWGIDQGWADAQDIDLTASPAAAPDGTYTLTVSIAPPYRRELGVAAADASVSSQLKVVTQPDGGCTDVCPPVPGPVPARGHARGSGAHQSSRAVPRGPVGSYPGQTDTSGGLPDLIALPAHGLSISHVGTRDFLNFGATIWNAGPGTFDIEGFRRGGKPTMQARQYIYRDGHSVRSMKIGTFEFDTRVGHEHWHLEDVAEYELLDSDQQRIVRSDKQSFCLAPTDPINLTVPGSLWNPYNIGLTSACPTDQSLWLRETLPVGWGDTYVQEKGGQAFNITEVPNGTYLIRITTNPRGRIHETTLKNNTALLPITLGGTPGARTVTKAPPITTK